MWCLKEVLREINSNREDRNSLLRGNRPIESGIGKL